MQVLYIDSLRSIFSVADWLRMLRPRARDLIIYLPLDDLVKADTWHDSACACNPVVALYRPPVVLRDWGEIQADPSRDQFLIRARCKLIGGWV
jgi:hypothetical protein